MTWQCALVLIGFVFAIIFGAMAIESAIRPAKLPPATRITPP